MNSDQWQGMYNGTWRGVITPEAFTHPAKFSRKLIARIYEHAREEGWLQANDVVLDPFGGVALGALDAMRLGLNWIGVELEPKFVDLGNQNIQLWQQRYRPQLPGWGTASLVKGDSRKLLEIVPPVLAALISSPPYADGAQHTGGDNKPGKLQGGKMRLPGLDGVVASPPYASTDQNYREGWERFHANHEPLWKNDRQRDAEYGETPGQLAAMKPGDLDGLVSSPPYAARDDRKVSWGSTTGKTLEDYDKERGYAPISTYRGYYSNDPANPGNPTGVDQSTFWEAAYSIVWQCYQLLRPGGVAIWIVKDYVKNKQAVDFSGNWQRMCEHIGFQTVHNHHAMLVSRSKIKHQLFDDQPIVERIERKSFFKRLAEKKGSPRIDWEVIQCMVKPII